MVRPPLPMVAQRCLFRADGDWKLEAQRGNELGQCSKAKGHIWHAIRQILQKKAVMSYRPLKKDEVTHASRETVIASQDSYHV
jgi:hypothetical protein